MRTDLRFVNLIATTGELCVGVRAFRRGHDDPPVAIIIRSPISGTRIILAPLEYISVERKSKSPQRSPNLFCFEQILEASNGRPFQAISRNNKIVMFVLQREKSQAGVFGHGGDGGAPVGTGLRDGGRDGVV